ncbi:MAG: hypothetical protein KAH04_01500 [Psychrilyobacter sp.]|nr:hypothetical protein [Psychrilyobacter sp.]
MKKRIVILLGLSILLFTSCTEDDKVDLVAGASTMPITKDISLKKSEVMSRYFITINGDNKFVGYYAKYTISPDKYYKIRINGAGPDKKWFTPDDTANKYYTVTSKGGKKSINDEYSENKDKGIPYFGKDDKITKRTIITKYNQDGKALEEDIYKMDKISGVAVFEYKNGKVVKRVEKDLNGKLNGFSEYTYTTVDGLRVDRRTDYKADKSLRRSRETYYDKNGVKVMLIKFDDLNRQVAVEKYGNIRRSYN